ncbi:histidine kinase dimerization/phospho-acceptor domain-containing protein [Paenibacillus rhizoplanae]
MELFAMLSHEIRTPMNGIIGMTDLMMTTDMNEQQQYYMEIIESSNSKLLQFLNDVLDFSKMEAGKLLIEKKNRSTLSPHWKRASICSPPRLLRKKSGGYSECGFGDSPVCSGGCSQDSPDYHEYRKQRPEVHPRRGNPDRAEILACSP